MFRALIIVLASLALPSAAQSRDLEATVVRVQDGDTIAVLAADGRRFSVRLAEIDAPEKDQPFADRSRKYLSSIVLRKTVSIRITDVDRYRRLVGRVYVNEADVSALMVQRGMAWANLPYITDQRFITWEKQARASKLGLWAIPEAQRIPPWDQRAKSASPSSPPQSARASRPNSAVSSRATLETAAASGQCGVKRRCSEMRNCAEARFYLRQCGLSGLDRDRNGIPCEALCR